MLSTLPVAAATQQWVEVRSPHFVVVTDGGEKRGREVALRFEQIRAAFGQVIYKNLKVNVPVPVEIVAFRNSKQMRRYTRLWNGKPVEMAGVFQPGEDCDFIALDLSAEGEWQVVYHEFTHLILHANFSAVPLWFDEGFAEYFSSLQVERDTISFGNASEGRGRVLSSTRWLPLDVLFNVGHSSPEYNEKGDHRSIFYAESWLVVHYLMTKHKAAEASTFMNLQLDHVPVAEAFQRAFGMPLAQFNKVLHDYFNGKGLLFQYPFPREPNLDSASYSSRMLSDTEGAAVLADLHLHEEDHQAEAVEEFEEVLAKQPDNATAHRGLGYAYLRRGEFEKAEQHFEKAVSAGSAEAETHYLYALMLTRRGKWDKSPEGLMKRELQAAIRLNPEYADAYNLLAVAQAHDEDYESAIASETRAYQLSRREAYQMNLAQYYASQKKFNEAEELLRTLSNSSDGSIAAAARTNLENVARYREYQERTAEAGSVRVVPQQEFKESDASRNESTISQAPPSPLGTPGTVGFAKGKLLSVDCSSGTEATLSVEVGGKTWKVHTKNRSKLVLINADLFSCDWRDRKVSMNYRQTGDSERELMSLELD